MVEKELRDRMEKMSQFELQELAAYADQLRSEARGKEIARGLDEILDKWQQLLACVRRVKRDLGIEDICIDVCDWSYRYAGTGHELITIDRYTEGDDFTFSASCRDDGERVEQKAK